MTNRLLRGRAAEVAGGVQLFVELEEDAAGRFRVDEHLFPVPADAGAAEGLDVFRAERRGCGVGVGDFQRDVMETGAAFAQELGDEAVFAEGLEDLPLHLALAVGAGDVENDAGETRLGIAEAAGFLPAEDFGEEGELVVDFPDGHAHVVDALG